MVVSRFSALAFLSLSSCVVGACVKHNSSVEANTSTTFTFAQWIEDIIADPSGDHLSPAQAVAAKNATTTTTTGIQKRYNCDYEDWPRADATAAAAGLTFLAGLGAAGVECDIGLNTYSNQTYVGGNSQLVSTKSSADAQGANWYVAQVPHHNPRLGQKFQALTADLHNSNDIARTGGLIFDSCWRSDNTILGSEICITNSAIQVNILGV